MNNSINTVITSSIILLGLLASCVSTSTIQISSTTSPIPTISNTPIPEITPTLSVTTTPKIKPSLTTVSIQYFRLGSPFAADFGDGIPRIWSNDAYNAPWYANCNDDRHGHVDWFIPLGANTESYHGEVIAPVSGFIKTYNDDQGELLGIHLFLDRMTYPEGIQDALLFAGIDSLNLNKISDVYLDIGHLKNVKTGRVKKGDSIADVKPSMHFKIGYKIAVVYAGKEYALSPSNFPIELSNGLILKPMTNSTSENWSCVGNSPYDCVSQREDYAPRSDCVGYINKIPK